MERGDRAGRRAGTGRDGGHVTTLLRGGTMQTPHLPPAARASGPRRGHLLSHRTCEPWPVWPRMCSQQCKCEQPPGAGAGAGAGALHSAGRGPGTRGTSEGTPATGGVSDGPAWRHGVDPQTHHWVFLTAQTGSTRQTHKHVITMADGRAGEAPLHSPLSQALLRFQKPGRCGPVPAPWRWLPGAAGGLLGGNPAWQRPAPGGRRRRAPSSATIRSTSETPQGSQTSR